MGESKTKVIVVTPHPDDAEFGAAGTVARWAKEGREIIYVVCTNGDKGSSDLDMTSEKLAQIRRQEQKEATKILGVSEVVFLDHPDGGLEDTSTFRGELVRLIRKHRPDVVITYDPYYPNRRYLIHRDHRITGMVTLDAIFPYARDHLSYPEHKAEGLMPHKVGEVYLWGSAEPDTFVDITKTFSLKLTALNCHVSQVGQRGVMLKQRLEERAREMGRNCDVPLAEAFRTIKISY